MNFEQELSSLKLPIVIYGMGELGTLFSSGFLKLGHPIVPILRNSDIASAFVSCQRFSPCGLPALVLIAVDIQDLVAILENIPATWSDRIVLLQNELLPNVWRSVGLKNHPSIMVIWLEKKRNALTKLRSFSKEIIYSPCSATGDLLEQALNVLYIPTVRLRSESDILQEMVLKNCFNLVMNVCGLALGIDSTFGELLADTNTELRNLVATEAILLQQYLCKSMLNQDALKAQLFDYMQKVPEMRCQGRYARARLGRALLVADSANLPSPELRRIEFMTRIAMLASDVASTA